MGFKAPKAPPLPIQPPEPVDQNPVNPAVKKARSGIAAQAQNIRRSTLLTSSQGLPDLSGRGSAPKTLLGT